MKYTFEQLKEAEVNLPNDVKEAISSIDFIYTVRDVSKKYNLHIDKMGELSDEISLVMLGLTHPSHFLGNIKTRLGVDEKVAEDIVKEVNEKIFKPIKKSLVSIHRDGGHDTNKERDTNKEHDTNTRMRANDTNREEGQLNSESVEQKNIVEEKLGQPFKIPKTETEHKGKETPSTTNSGYKDVDPYREPLE